MARELLILRNHHPMEYLSKTKFDRPAIQLQAMMDMEYPADPLLEPHLVGMTFGQVALMQQVTQAAGGNGYALDRVLNRMIGTPINTNVNVNKEMTYQDFLDNIAVQDQATHENHSKAIDVKHTVVRESEKIS